MTETPTHTVLTVCVAAHERERERTAWRIRHAADTFGIVFAWFTSTRDGVPVQADDGTFEVHAPSRGTLGTLRQMLDHEGLTVISEDERPGMGIIACFTVDGNPA